MFVLIVLFGCTEDIMLAPTFDRKQVVVFSILEAGKIPTLRLTSSYNPYDTSDREQLIRDDVLAVLLSDGVLNDTLVFNEELSLFAGSQLIEHGKSYAYMINVASEVVTSNMVEVPALTVIDSVYKNDDESYTFIAFSDDKTIDNYYGYEMVSDFLKENSFIAFSSIKADLRDLPLCDFYEDGLFNDGGAFTDQCFLSDTQVLRLSTDVDGLNAAFDVYLYSISYDLFLFSKTLTESRSSDFQAVSIDPTRIHSNINNGLGIVGAMTFDEVETVFD
jgi:hypothetical protein